MFAKLILKNFVKTKEMTSSNYDVLDLEKLNENPYCPHGIWCFWLLDMEHFIQKFDRYQVEN